MPRTTWPAVVVSLALGFGSGGCEREQDWSERLGTYPWPIVDGTRETGERAVVFIYNDRGAGCTASVIAPRVALTAKHCVQGMSASGWHVIVGPSMYAVVEELGVTETRMTPGYSIENLDIGVMILDRDFEHGFKRWEFTPWPGFRAGVTITAIGYGQTDPSDSMSAGTKYRRDGYVASLSGSTEFITRGENTCQGDSGGPILFEDVVVGIVSRGEDGCTGYGLMTRVSAWTDLVKQALADTGACVPTSLEVCDGVDNDCWLGVDDALGPTCACSDGAAGRPETCNGVDDDCNNAIDDLASCACSGGNPPGTEVCNGIDDDCNGQIDEVCLHLGSPCGADTECSGGLCLDTGTGVRVCTARCSAGAAATCPDGGYCDAMACAEGLCRPAGEGGELPPGAGCAAGGDCASRFCAALPDGSAICARPCTPYALGCYSDEACVALADACGACVDSAAADPPREFGEPCRVDADCVSGFCLTDGDPAACGNDCAYRYCAVSCGTAGECPTGAHCRDGVCVRGPASDLGETCITDADCLGGYCVLAPGGVARCLDLCTPEGGCAAGFVCADGACWPDVLRPGDPCGSVDTYCEGGTCTEVEGTVVCITPCTSIADCNSGTSCMPVAENAAVCVPPFADGGDGGDGCGCRAASRGGAPSLVLFVLGAAFLRLRRRAR